MTASHRGSSRSPMRKALVAMLVAATFSPHGSRAAPDKYNVTPEEHAACDDDAARLCSDAYPDEDKLIACMRINRSDLSRACRPVFESGMRKRHMPL